MRRRALVTMLSACMVALVVSAAPAPAFVPGQPFALTGTGAATSSVRAVVSVEVDPLGPGGEYSVQYGTSAEYGESTTTKAIPTSTRGRASFRVVLRGLTPGALYHYRVAATNLRGTTYGQDETFATWPVQIPFLSHGVVSANNERTRATGLTNGQRPHGWIMLIHGGGWRSTGRSIVQTERTTAMSFARLGWSVDSIDYRPGERSLPDVLAAYDALRKRVGHDVPICLAGQSAGGHLALLTAEYRQSVACVISAAGPTDLVHLAAQHAYIPDPPQQATYTAQLTFDQIVVPAFGVDPKVLREWSPVHRAGRISARLLLGASTYDEVVPQHQMAELRHAMTTKHATGTIKTMLLPGADTPTDAYPNFTHASVTSGALAAWDRAERVLLRQVAS